MEEGLQSALLVQSLMTTTCPFSPAVILSFVQEEREGQEAGLQGFKWAEPLDEPRGRGP